MSNRDNGHKRIYSNKHIVFVIAFAINCVTFAQELRTWTGSNGSTLQATFVREDGEQVVLLSRDGRIIKTKRLNLAKYDQDYLDSLKPTLVNLPVDSLSYLLTSTNTKTCASEQNIQSKNKPFLNNVPSKFNFSNLPEVKGTACVHLQSGIPSARFSEILNTVVPSDVSVWFTPNLEFYIIADDEGFSMNTSEVEVLTGLMEKFVAWSIQAAETGVTLTKDIGGFSCSSLRKTREGWEISSRNVWATCKFTANGEGSTDTLIIRFKTQNDENNHQLDMMGFNFENVGALLSAFERSNIDMRVSVHQLVQERKAQVESKFQ